MAGSGSAPEAAIAIGVFTTFLSMLRHANIRTAHWLGYLIVRPESHTLHHERGVHGRNYCDFPLIDILFGTFANPRECRVEAGFFDGSSRPVGKLLAGRLIA